MGEGVMTSEVTEEELRLMINYGGDPYKRRTVEEEVVFEQYGYEEWPLAEFLKQLNEAVAKIPEASRSEAMVGACESVRLVISFPRPETDDEMANRVDHALRYARERLRDEKHTYERLRQKYG